MPGVEDVATAATLTAIPTPSTSDTDGNAVDDAWELFFFGEPADPWADNDGDGISNFQEALEIPRPAANRHFYRFRLVLR